MDSDCFLTFWGVRGSIPSPGVNTIGFGGNTPCVSIECSCHQDNIIIFDAGSGIRSLGKHLMQRKDPHTINGSIFLTHTHWDHIQGLPFFIPAFLKENQFSIYGEGKPNYSLPKLIKEQIQAPFFPVDINTLFQAKLDFNEISEDEAIELEKNIRVTPFRLVHPNAALGYLLQISGHSIAYVTDHEHEMYHPSPAILDTVAGVDVLIHDAQYSREELVNGKQGWGHSAWEDVVELAANAQVKQLFLFHHDPDATDAQLNERQFQAQQIFPNTFVAREGMKIPLATGTCEKHGQSYLAKHLPLSKQDPGRSVQA